MRRIMAGGIVAAAAIIIGSGAAFAGEKAKAPEAGTWEYQWALETGTLPASHAVKEQKNGAPAGERAATVEIGGRVYRIGLDTP